MNVPANLVPAATFLSVIFLYLDEEGNEKQYQALCTAIPREGEIVSPEAGSKQVIVHAVAHKVDQLPGIGAILIPLVFLRDLNADEQKKYLIVGKKDK